MNLEYINMIELVKYKTQNKQEWDSFLDISKISTFLFKRDFMEYHSDRFVDCSFLIYIKSKLKAILPGNIFNNSYFSHQGLTYGGLICSPTTTTKEVLEIFTRLNDTLKSEGIKEVVYKPTPHIYHKYPSEEDIYALYRLGAVKIACNISSTIFQKQKQPFTQSRKGGVNKAINNNVRVLETTDYSDFWRVLEDNLARTYSKKPVHSLEEIQKLSDSFPNNIRLFCAYLNDLILGGTVLFIAESIVHVQYISANQRGKAVGALDLIFDKLINELFRSYSIFDFGQSTEQEGNYLNEGLIFQKEGFGGRGIVYETYKYSL